MNASELHDLTAPLFAKHPSAKPERMEYRTIAERWVSIIEDGRSIRQSNGLTDDHAALIIQGHLAQWLAEKVNEERHDLEIEVYKGKWFVKWEPDGYHSGNTLLHALVAACMEVEQ